MQPMPCTQSTLREAACRKLTLAARGLSPNSKAFHGFCLPSSATIQASLEEGEAAPLSGPAEFKFWGVDELRWFFDDFLLFVLKLLIPSSELWWEWLKSASASFRPRSPLASTRYAAPDLSWSWPSTCHGTFFITILEAKQQKSSKIRWCSQHLRYLAISGPSTLHICRAAFELWFMDSFFSSPDLGRKQNTFLCHTIEIPTNWKNMRSFPY